MPQQTPIEDIVDDDDVEVEFERLMKTPSKIQVDDASPEMFSSYEKVKSTPPTSFGKPKKVATVTPMSSSRNRGVAHTSLRRSTRNTVTGDITEKTFVLMVKPLSPSMTPKQPTLSASTTSGNSDEGKPNIIDLTTRNSDNIDSTSNSITNIGENNKDCGSNKVKNNTVKNSNKESNGSSSSSNNKNSKTKENKTKQNNNNNNNDNEDCEESSQESGESLSWNSPEEEEKQQARSKKKERHLRSTKTLQRPRTAAVMCRRDRPDTKRNQATGVGGGRGSSGRQRKARVAFSYVEEQNLLQGVEKYGIGSWSTILDNFTFHSSRTNVSLKDKYRTLQNQGRV